MKIKFLISIIGKATDNNCLCITARRQQTYSLNIHRVHLIEIWFYLCSSKRSSVWIPRSRLSVCQYPELPARWGSRRILAASGSRWPRHQRPPVSITRAISPNENYPPISAPTRHHFMPKHLPWQCPEMKGLLIGYFWWSGRSVFEPGEELLKRYSVGMREVKMRVGWEGGREVGGEATPFNTPTPCISPTFPPLSLGREVLAQIPEHQTNLHYKTGEV